MWEESVGESWSKVSLGINTRPYLKSKHKGLMGRGCSNGRMLVLRANATNFGNKLESP
jgi:hypothetical protein